MSLVKKQVVYVTHFKDPSRFFVQMEAAVSKFNRLCNDINRYCRGVQGRQAHVTTLDKGMHSQCVTAQCSYREFSAILFLLEL